jgi:hypothetical protein
MAGCHRQSGLADPGQSSPGSLRAHGDAHFVYEFWRFVFVQQVVGKLAQTALDFPPMQKGASFNLQALKEELDKKMASHASQ